MFWGPEKLRQQMADRRVERFDEDRIDGAAYHLAIGREIYVSPTAGATDASTTSIRRLKSREAFVIRPGQFAFLSTDEKIRVECGEMALISIRAKTKYRGLVNVSGFHVDPGFYGRLNFAVFNAGPVPVHLRQGDQIFLIWYADLSDPVTRPRPPEPHGIRSEWVSGIGGKLHSLASLANAVTTAEQRLDKRLDAVTRELAIFRAVALIAATGLVGIAVKMIFFSDPS